MMAEGRVVSTPLCGVRNYVYCKDGNYSKYGIVDAPIIEEKASTTE